MKKVLVVVLVFICVISVGQIFVSAATVTEKVSTLTLGLGQSYQGSTVKHTKKNIRFGVSPQEIYNTNLRSKLVLRLYKKNLIGSTFKKVKTMPISTSFSTLFDFGYVGSGKYFYVFKTCNNEANDACTAIHEPYSGFYANPVQYYSCD